MATKRRNGVNKFWKQERVRLQNGQKWYSDWSPKQKADILKGKRPKHS